MCQQVLPMTELHGLSSSRPFVQQGSVGHWHAGDVTNHGLVVEERLQATLRDFGLVGCILSYPDNGTGTVSRAAWFRTGGQQHKSWGRRRRGSGQWNALCDSLVMEICRKSKNHLASHERRSQGLWLKAASLNYSLLVTSGGPWGASPAGTHQPEFSSRLRWMGGGTEQL